MKSKPPVYPPSPLIETHIDPPDSYKIESLKYSPTYAKYAEKYKKSEDQKANKVAKEIAAEKKKKKMDFLLDLVKALIIAVATLSIEHFMDIVRFFQDFLSGFSQG